MFATEIDLDDTTPAPARRPIYTSIALRRMSVEDRLDAALTNLARTGRARDGRRADRAVRTLVGAR